MTSFPVVLETFLHVAPPSPRLESSISNEQVDTKTRKLSQNTLLSVVMYIDTGNTSF